jgi:GntR family transcriptional regulator
VTKINPYSAVPLHAQLAAILRERIRAGELRRLDLLPSESTLQQEYGVARGTVRQAMRNLRDEGVVFTVPQRGSYVGPPPEPGEKV